MKVRGVTTLINIRTPGEMTTVPFDEAALAAQLGMKYVTIPSGGPEHPFSPATVAAFADALQHADGKVLLHCQVGWRARHLWAAYLIKERGVSVDSALANASVIGPLQRPNMGAAPVELFLARPLPEIDRLGKP
jgi:uncharacterized protein (TIGR01244 family)